MRLHCTKCHWQSGGINPRKGFRIADRECPLCDSALRACTTAEVATAKANEMAARERAWETRTQVLGGKCVG